MTCTTPPPPGFVHLIDRRHPAAPAVLASLAAMTGDLEHRVIALGSRQWAGELAGYGLAVTDASSLAMLRRRRPGQGQVVIAWSSRCAVAAAVMWPGLTLRWVAFEEPGRWRGALLRRAGASGLCFTDEMAGRLEQAGLKGQRVTPLFDPRLLGKPVRDRWACGPGDRVVALLADDPRRVSVLGGVVAVSIAEEAARDEPDAPRLRLLAHPEADDLPRGWRIAQEAEASHRLIVDDDLARPWRLLAGCDAVLLWGQRTALARQWATAAGLPCVEAPDGDSARAAAGLRAVKPAQAAAPAPSDDLSDWRQALAIDLTPQAL